MAKIALILLAVIPLLKNTESAGAGRAFPVESENYATERFQTVNSRLEWDPSNFLVDLSGHYANCRSVGQSGPVSVEHRTPEGESISGVVDNVDGSRADSDAVNGYIRTVVDRWISSRHYNGQIRNARRFGCSVRPACTGRAVISCLFSPGSDYQNEQPEEPSNIETDDKQHALAFTPEQYQMAELFTGNKWDRSHFLENLSGYETSCAMIDTDDWPFTTVRRLAAQHGLHVTPVYGIARNLGNTDDALGIVLESFKEIQDANELGCSIIPDCIRHQEMFVVVSCLYETS